MEIKSSFTFYQVVEDLLDQTAKNVDKICVIGLIFLTLNKCKFTCSAS